MARDTMCGIHCPLQEHPPARPFHAANRGRAGLDAKLYVYRRVLQGVRHDPPWSYQSALVQIPTYSANTKPQPGCGTKPRHVRKLPGIQFLAIFGSLRS
eukprot:2632129-Rhodomonas_salina.1